MKIFLKFWIKHLYPNYTHCMINVSNGVHYLHQQNIVTDIIDITKAGLNFSLLNFVTQTMFSFI